MLHCNRFHSALYHEFFCLQALTVFFFFYTNDYQNSAKSKAGNRSRG